MTSKNVIVPCHPKPEMILAGVPEHSQYGLIYAEATYRAMLSAAPQLSEVEMVEKVSEAIWDDQWSLTSCDTEELAKAALRALGLIDDANQSII